MTTDEKCVAVLAAVSRPRNDLANLDETDRRELAAIYDRCLGDGYEGRVDFAFSDWRAARRKRREEAAASLEQGSPSPLAPLPEGEGERLA